MNLPCPYRHGRHSACDGFPGGDVAGSSGYCQRCLTLFRHEVKLGSQLYRPVFKGHGKVRNGMVAIRLIGYWQVAKGPTLSSRLGWIGYITELCLCFDQLRHERLRSWDTCTRLRNAQMAVERMQGRLSTSERIWTTWMVLSHSMSDKVSVLLLCVHHPSHLIRRQRFSDDLKRARLRHAGRE